jgi:hypothetical protein
VTSGRVNSLIFFVQMKCLGGRLSDSGTRSGLASAGTKATRVADRGSGTSCTKFGNPAAQQEAHTVVQQAPTQFRSEEAGASECPR